MRPETGDRVALITGGTRGIGAATASILAGRGYRVCLTYLADRDSASRLVARLQADTEAVAVQADAAREDDAVRSFEVAESLGRVEVLVNNAGQTWRIGPLRTWSGSDLARVVDGNLMSSLVMCRVAAERWSGDGRDRCIVNVSSAAAVTGAPGEYVAYAAAKAGVDVLTVGLARELAAEGIRVNGVSPGTTDTEIHAAAGDPGRGQRVAASVPFKRIAEPSEVAHAIAWLASSEASYVSGEVLKVTGAA